MTQATPLAAASLRPTRVLAVASHPIQYQAPWFRALALADDLDFSVLFVQMPSAQQQGAGFGVAFEWDIPLLQGYRWQVAPEVRGPGGLDGFFATRLSKASHLLRELQPDVLLLTGWHIWPLVQLLLAAHRVGVPVIMRGESNNLRPRWWLPRLLHRWLLSRCAAFLPIGRASRAFYQAYGIENQCLFDTPYFIDNARFENAAAALTPRRANLRATWRIPPDAICYCFAGKLEPKKRILDVLQALRTALTQSSAPLHLLVVGMGEQMEQARAFVAQNKLPVSFAGFLNQTEMPSAYVAADCLILASDYGETWGLVVNEAMACGRAAIVSDRAGCATDLIIPGVTGVTFPFGDTDALAAQMLELATPPDRLRTMGATAQAHVLRGYTVQRAVEGTVQAVSYVQGAR